MYGSISNSVGSSISRSSIEVTTEVVAAVRKATVISVEVRAVEVGAIVIVVNDHLLFVRCF